MENASKALIIAASVLLAILVISLGVFIFFSVKDNVSNKEFSAEEIRTFNSQFITYDENSLYGREVKTLIQKVISSNKNHEVASKQVSIKYGNEYKSVDELLELSSKILENAIYKIEINQFGASGLVEQITISSN